MPRLQLGHNGERAKDDGATERGEADIEVEHKADGEIDRYPRQIEERHRADPGEEAAHRIEIANRLRPLGFVADLERQADDGVVDPRTHRLVEATADAHQDAAADHVDDALRGVHAGRQKQQRDQRRHAPAGKHPVVNLEHEQRAREHQKIAHAAEHRDGVKCPAARAKRVCELGTGGLLP